MMKTYVDHSDLNRRIALIALILLFLGVSTFCAYLAMMYLTGRW